MSEFSTSPDTTSEAPAEAPVESVESAAPSGGMTEPTTVEATGGFSEEATTTDETPEVPPIDLGSWDGNIDNLPENLREPVRFLHRQLESGYTKKFQSLSDERKAFETAKTESENAPGWERERGKLNEELKLLRSLMGGDEDPRVTEYLDKNGVLTQQLAELQGEYDQFKTFIEEDITEQAAVYADQFREKHSAIFDNADKRQMLSDFLDQGWSPEAGVKLMGYSPKVSELAQELKDRGVPSEVAVEHAVIKIGSTSTRNPRPAARLTSGATSRNNPESVKQTVNNANTPGEARLMAARAAMNWQSKNKLT